MNMCLLTGESVMVDGRRGTPTKWDGGLRSPDLMSCLFRRGSQARLSGCGARRLKPPPSDLVKSHLPPVLRLAQYWSWPRRKNCFRFVITTVG